MAESGQYSRSVLGASDEIKDIYCEPCHNDGKTAIAEGYCKDCPEYLCAQCYKSHRRNKVLANHVLLDRNSMPIAPGSIRTVLEVCKEKCTIHSDEVIKFFCGTCDKLGCTICITLDHRQCDKVRHIPDIVKDLKHSEEFMTFQEGIKSTVDKLSEFEQKIQANANSNNEMQKLAKRELKHQRDEVNRFFDQLEKKMDDKILMIEQANKDVLKAASDTLEPLKKDLDQIKNDIEAKKTGQNCELFISMKRNKETMKTLEDQLNNIQEQLTIQHYTLLPSEQIQAMMRNTTEICRISTGRTTTDICSIPVSRTTTDTCSKPVSRTTTDICSIPVSRTTKDACRISNARLKSVINIKTSTDKTEPSISILTIIHGHYCVAVDNNNKSIKVVDTKSKLVTSEIGIEAKHIWSVTSVSDDQVAVSLSAGKEQINFFSVSQSGVIQRTNQVINIAVTYLDIVHYKGNIYGLRGRRTSIDILSMTGKIVKTIETDDKGAALFDFLERISLSPDGQTIYVTDSNKHSITSLTSDGKVKAIYTDTDLKKPGGIAVDKYRYVYVRSLGTNNIQQLTADLNKVQVLIKNVFGKNITYSSTENKLYTCINDNIKVYSLDFK